jgi:DNA repair exonuclease SbcCD nuclease subunit
MFSYNEFSFYELGKTATGKDQKTLLAVTYCTLVTVELILKRVLSISGNHDIPAMLKTACTIKPKHQIQLTSFSRQLRNSLQAIYVQDKYGNSRLTPSESYPFIRYFRHNSDWPSPSQAEDEIFSLLNDAKQIQAFLKKNF